MSERGMRRNLLTFEDRFRPIEIRRVIEILSVEDQTLSELQQCS